MMVNDQFHLIVATVIKREEAHYNKKFGHLGNRVC
mgnify:CR=1 FL=1